MGHLRSAIQSLKMPALQSRGLWIWTGKADRSADMLRLGRGEDIVL